MLDASTWPIKPTLGSIVAVFVLGKLIQWRRKVKMLPPGPPKLPVIDNLHNMPLGLDWVQFSEMGKRYNSDMIHLSALGNSILVLNSFNVAQELLEKRSGIYSSRPVATMTHELSGFNMFFAFIEYGDFWRTSRRLFTKHFGMGSMPSNWPRELLYARQLLKHTLEKPEKFLDHLHHMVCSMAISMTYGLKPQTVDDPNIELSAKTAEAMSEIAGAGAYLVDILPFLKYLPDWIPGTGFKKQASACKKLCTEVRGELFEAGRKAMASSDYEPSFISEALQEWEQEGGMRDELEMLKDTAAMVFQAAADTTWSALGTLFLALVCYPEVQQRLQNELDAVLGGRLPEHDDVVDLPYLTAVWMEALRWKPVTPIGVPHKVIMDDIYKGSIIPKDSVVIANQWAMLQDPNDYPEPSEFRPERFLKDGKLDPSVRDPEDIAFGFGRRMCPGRHVARSVALLTVSSVLTSFDLLMKRDSKGQVIKPAQEYHVSFLCHPKDFPCEIVPRSKEMEEVIGHL